jgi:hypothetical protein
MTKFCMVVPIIWGPQYGMCFMSPSWHLDFWGGSCIFGKFVHPCTEVSYSCQNPQCLCSRPDDITHLVQCAVTSLLCSCCQRSCARLPMWYGSCNMPRVFSSVLCGTTTGQTILVTPRAWLHATLSSRLQGLPYHRSAPLPTVNNFSG